MSTMIGYLRVSTDEQSNSGLGPNSQREIIQRYADAHDWDVGWYEDAGLSAKSLDRPRLQAALARLHVIRARRDVAGIVVAKLDRLSRSVVDFAGVLELARTRKWARVAIDFGADTSTPTGELVANVMMSVAQWECRVIGGRTSAAMQAARHQGRHMGRVSAPAQSTVDRLLILRATHALAGTATQLNVEGVTTATGAAWSANHVAKTHKRLT